jgi:hypothetical protein
VYKVDFSRVGWYNHRHEKPRAALTAGVVATNGISIGRKRDCKSTNPLLLPIAREDFFMSDITLTSQAELFPENSPFHSKHALKSRLAELAAKSIKVEQKDGRPIRDITGNRYGMITVIGLSGEKFNGSPVFVCRCDCGREIKAVVGHLERKKHPITDCGCQGISKYNVPRPGRRGIGGYNSGGRSVKPNPRAAFKGLQANYRYQAAKRGYTWELTESEFLRLVQADCHYCGALPNQVYATGSGHEFTYNGVDRIDSEKPYTVVNCVPCCGDCNTAKMGRNVNDFLIWVEHVYKHSIVKGIE